MAPRSKSMPGRCPNCGSTNIQAEPLYPYDDEDEYSYYDENEIEAEGDLAVFCVSCGHYMGEMASHLTARLHVVRSQALDQFKDDLKA